MNRNLGLALRVAIPCNTMMVFGFLYEEIVDVPNLIGAHGREAQALWNAYHWLTNPIHFYVVPGIVVELSLLFLWLRRRALPSADRARLMTALGGHVGTAVLTGIAVTQINNHLYFGPPIDDPARVRFLAVTWFVVNAVRIVSTAVTTVSLTRISRNLLTGTVDPGRATGAVEGTTQGVRRGVLDHG